MEEQPIQQQPSQPEVKKPRKIVFLILGVVLLVLIVGGGVMVASRQNKTAQVSPTPSVEVSPTIAFDPMVDWKIYEGKDKESHGFSFKYPSDWIVENGNVSQQYPNTNPNKEIIYFGEPQTKNHIGQTVAAYPVSSFVLSYETDPAFASKQLSDFANDYQFKEKQENVTIGGIQALKVPYSGSQSGDSLVTILKNGSTVYLFSIPYGATKGALLFDQILSTFKFTDQAVDTSNWKTYTNNEYKFRLEYPNDWEVKERGNVDVSGFTVSFGPNTSSAPEDTNTKMSIGIVKPNQNTLIRNASDVVKIGTPPPPVMPTVETISFNGLTAYKKKEPSASTIIAFDKDGLVYSIMMFHREHVDNIDPKIYDQILSTFKFTN